MFHESEEWPSASVLLNDARSCINVNLTRCRRQINNCVPVSWFPVHCSRLLIPCPTPVRKCQSVCLADLHACRLVGLIGSSAEQSLSRSSPRASWKSQKRNNEQECAVVDQFSSFRCYSNGKACAGFFFVVELQFFLSRGFRLFRIWVDTQLIDSRLNHFCQILMKRYLTCIP